MIDKPPADLSERELEILRLVATGASNKEIAQKLFISTNTVKVHLRNIFAKVGVSSRTEAAMLIMRQEQDGAGVPPYRSSLEPAEADDSPAAVLPMPISVTETEESPASPRRAWVVLFSLILFSAIITGAVLFSNLPAVPAAGTLIPPETRSPSRWRSLADLPAPRFGMAVAAYENHHYLIGGEDASGVVGAAERYDFSANQYQSISPKPVPVADAGAVVIAGYILVPGGRLASGAPTDALEVYDPRQDVWARRASLPVPLSGYAVTAFEGRLYLFGGWDGQRYLATVFRYDPEGDLWQEMTAMPTARAYSGAAVAGGKIFVLGGFDGEKALDVNEVYVPEREALGENPWLPAKPLPDSRYGMGIANVADFIQVIGGERAERDSYAAIAYSASQDEWLLLESPEQDLGAFLGASASGGEMFVFGGKVGGSPARQSLVYQVIYTLSIPVIIK